MDQILGASVEIDVGLDRGRLGVVGVAGEASIVHSLEIHNRVEHSKFNQRPNSLRGHGSHNGSSNGLIPSHGEIGLGTNAENKGEGAIATIKVLERCVVEHDQDGGVNELTDKDGDHSVVGL